MDWGLLSHSIGPRLRLVRDMLHVRSIAVSEPFGLPMGSLTIMSLIEANPESSQARISRLTGISSPALVKIIDALEEKGLVERVRSKKDRRKNLIRLTLEGSALAHRLFSEVTQIEAPIREALSDKEMKDLLDYVDRAIVALRAAGVKDDLRQARPPEAK